MKVCFTGGREDTPQLEIVPSTYYDRVSNEVQLKITQNEKEIVLSEETLRYIAVWFSSVTMSDKIPC